MKGRVSWIRDDLLVEAPLVVGVGTHPITSGVWQSSKRLVRLDAAHEVRHRLAPPVAYKPLGLLGTCIVSNQLYEAAAACFGRGLDYPVDNLVEIDVTEVDFGAVTNVMPSHEQVASPIRCSPVAPSRSMRCHEFQQRSQLEGADAPVLGQRDEAWLSSTR